MASPAKGRKVASPTDRREKTPTSAKQWKKASVEEDLELPSGNTARVKRVQLPKLIATGAFPDALTTMAQGHVDEGKGKAPKKKAMSVEDMIADPSKLQLMFDAFDRITAAVVIEPKVLYHCYVDGDEIPEGYSVGDDIPADERDDEVIYTDDVDFDDKQFIFQFVVGGTRDLEQFRGLQGSALGGA